MLSRALRAPWWWQAIVASLSAVAGCGLTLLLQLRDRPYLIPLVAVVFVALRGGFRAGVLCAVVTIVCTNYYLTPPAFEFSIPPLEDGYEAIIFAATAATISVLAGRRRDTQLTLEATVASIADGVIVTDDDGQVTFLNPVAEALTGWTLKEATGQPVHRVFAAVDEHTGEPRPNPVEEALHDDVRVTSSDHSRLLARDGSEHAIAESAAPIRDLGGRTVGAVLVFRDVTDQRNAELALKRQNEERQELLVRERNARAEAEHANRLKDEFLATLSHELRTPLNAVLGWSHMLTRRQLTATQQKEALEAIYRNAQAQARLVDDVLDLSRIVTGRLALSSEPVDLATIVHETAEAFAPAVLGKRQELRLQLAQSAEVHGDPHRLRQVVWNLLSNATKFTPPRGLIAVGVREADGSVELVVADNGQGIDPEFLPFVFDRFRQGDGSSTRGHGGLGLGLALVRHLVEAHGGEARAESPGPGQGTTIRITLPARSTEPSERMRDSEHPMTI